MARKRAASYEHMGRGMFASMQQRTASQQLRTLHTKPKPARAHEPLHLNKSGHAPQVPHVGMRAPAKAHVAEVFTEHHQEVLTEWEPMESSRIRVTRYDHGNHQIHVIFRDGTPWVYDDVPYPTYQEFIQSDSPGRFVNHTLNGFPYRRGDFIA